MNNTTSTTTFGTHVLTDGDRTAYMLITFSRTDTGTLTIAMTTPAATRHQPLRITLDGAALAERNIPAPAKPCDCPDDADSVIGGVHVRHRPDCLHGEPRQYIWQYAGTLYTGTLADYARHWETLDPEAQHALTHKRDELRTWEPHTYRLTITGDMAEDYWFHYRLSTGDEHVTVDIDPRH